MLAPSSRVQRNFWVPSPDTCLADRARVAQAGPASQIVPESPADVAHLPETGNPFIDPLEELPGPEAGLSPGGDEVFELRQGQFF